jgi:hypothetical protein
MHVEQEIRSRWSPAGSDVALVGESADDLLPADSMLGEVNWSGPLGSLGQVELAEGTMRAGNVLAAILMPSAVNTASKELVNWPARSLSGT